MSEMLATLNWKGMAILAAWPWIIWGTGCSLAWQFGEFDGKDAMAKAWPTLVMSLGLGLIPVYVIGGAILFVAGLLWYLKLALR